jgi:5-bromo-4-chloroindolyl phosphate hydrolysis protein
MKKRLIRSAVPIYLAALVWILSGLLLPMYKLSSILLAAGVSVAAWLLGGRFFPGRVVEEEEAPNSGDAEVNRQILEGRENLKSLKDAASSIPDEAVTAPLTRMIAAGDKIFKALEKNPRDSQQIRKFMNYYLPTSVKLLDHYKTLSAAGAGENVQKSLTSIAGSLNMIAEAFEKQLDRLYADDQLDINAEISALETMMAADGLTENLSIKRSASK